MSDLDKTNPSVSSASDFEDLLATLALEPVKLAPMPFGQFLRELPTHPERADTAYGVLVRAIEEAGEVDIESEPPQRRPYLRLLKELGIKSYNAFDEVRGCQRMVHAQMEEHLKPARSNGYQLFLAIVVKGPPGCGKSKLVDAYKNVLEGRIVYCVDSCPVHENPINLLRLLPEASINMLAKKLHLTDDECKAAGKQSLTDMLAVAGDPCQHCWSLVMENESEKDPNKALLALEVTPRRLSSRKFGVSTWTAGASFTASLERGSRGMVDMGELFDSGGNSAFVGNTPALKVLLDATNDRHIPAASHRSAATQGKDGKAAGEDGDDKVGNPHALHDSDATSYEPLDAVLFAQANEGAWKALLEALGEDAGKFTRRTHVFTLRHNTSVTEEEMAYGDMIAKLRDTPHFDPMVLKLMALLAVVSRLQPEHEVDIVQRARIYDGERLRVAHKAPTSGKSPAGQSEYWTVQDLWKMAGEDEALNGLDITVMFNLLSEVINRALTDRRHEGCISSYELITFLRARVSELERSSGFTAEQIKVLARCREKFLIAGAANGGKPGVLEAEYQRVLVRQLYEVAAPDFARRAEETFQRYRLHAQAYTAGDKTVDEPDDSYISRSRIRKVPVDLKFLNAVEEAVGLSTTTDRDSFRTAFETLIFKVVKERRERQDADSGSKPPEASEADINWKTLPRLADGIRRMLNKEIQQKLERLVKPPLELQDETEDDRRLRVELFARFDELGYCHHCRSQAIEYFRLNQLWNLQG